MRAIVVESFGGPEVLKIREVARPVPGVDETLIQVSTAGVNYTDLGRRERGWRLSAQPLPMIPGLEVAGRRVSDGVRVVGLLPTGVGGYAEYAVVRDELTVPIPDGVDDAAALAVLVQGLTGWHVVVSAARVQAGETVAVTAAAGGVGSLAIQIARLRGAGRVIAVASSEEKRRLTLKLGADAAIDSRPEGFTERLLEANGAPVDVVLESIGGPIVDRALKALAHGGRLVAYGQASGASNMVSLDDLMDHSIGVIGYWATPHMRDLIGTRRTIEGLLEHVASGRLRAVEGPSFPLADAPQAHASLAARATVGKVTLVVDDAARTTHAR
jgi:NADPH:quinone reductase